MSFGLSNPADGQGPRWLREQLLGLGLAEDQILFATLQGAARWTGADLNAGARPEFVPLAARLQQQRHGMGSRSICVAGQRVEAWARQHVAVQVALALVPTSRRVVLVDFDFLRPGLGGLVADDGSPGVADFVRTGQPIDSLLLHPVPGGPWLLSAGSSPVHLAALGPETVRLVLHHVAQVCDVAVYVTPLLHRAETPSLASVCDHVVYAGTFDRAGQISTAAESVRLLLAQDVHVAGVVLYAPDPAPATGAVSADSSSTLRPRAPEPFVWAAAAPSIADDPDRTIPPADPEPVSSADPLATRRLDVPPPAVAPSPAAPFRWEADAPEPRDMTSAARSRRTAPPPVLPAVAEDAPLRPQDKTRLSPERQRDLERQRKAAPRPRRGPPGRGRGPAGPRRVRPVVLLGGLAAIALAGLFVLAPRAWVALRSRMTAQPDGAPARPQEVAATNRVSGEIASNPPSEGATPAEATTSPTTGAGGSDAGDASAQAAAPANAVSASDPAAGASDMPNGTRNVTPSGAPNEAPPVEPTVREPVRNEPPPPPPSDADIPAPRASSGAEAYAVHVASYQSERQAAIEIATLRKRGYVAHALPVDLGAKGVWLRIYVGPYTTAADAQTARSALRAFPDYADAAVRRVPRE